MATQRIECKRSGKTVVITPVSARRLSLTPKYEGAEIIDDGELVGLNFDDEFEVYPSSVVPVQRDKYKIVSLSKMMDVEGNYSGYYLNIAELSKSSMFIMPFIGYSRRYFRWDSDFVNCFVATEDNPNERAIYLWYRYRPTLEMEAFEGKIKDNMEYRETIDVDKYHVLYKYSVPKRYLKDFNLILEGRYSYISSIAKERILDFHSSSRDRPLGNILHRDPERRKKMEKDLDIVIPPSADLHDPPYLEEETYKNSFKIPSTTF